MIKERQSGGMGMIILIENAFIVDGTGEREPYLGLILIEDNFIKYVGDIDSFIEAEPDLIIDAKGRYVTPGFIDMHTHTDLAYFLDEGLKPKIMQGVTTEVIGQCGFSVAPMPLGRQKQWREERLIIGNPQINWEWESLSEYLAALEQHGAESNIVPFVGHSTLRFAVAGNKAEPLTPRELRALSDLLEQSFQDGAHGVSLGLIYIPAVYAQREELEVIAKIVSRYDGIVAVHLRSESDELLEAINEMATIFCDVKLHISHLKAIGRRNWGKTVQALDFIDQHRLSFDHYPYLAGSTTLLSIFPPFKHRGQWLNDFRNFSDDEVRARIRDIFSGAEQVPVGASWDNLPDLLGWENIVISGLQGSSSSSLIGRSIHEIGEEEGEDPADIAMDLVAKERGQVMMIDFHSNRESILAKLEHSCGMIGTDALITGKPHPRVYGTYSKLLKETLVGDIQLPIEKIVMKMTSKPAERLGITDRGVIAKGYKADLVVFSKSVADKATYESPCAYSQGIDYVIIGGEIKVQEGVYSGEIKSGKIIRRGVRELAPMLLVDHDDDLPDGVGEHVVCGM